MCTLRNIKQLLVSAQITAMTTILEVCGSLSYLFIKSLFSQKTSFMSLTGATLGMFVASFGIDWGLPASGERSAGRGSAPERGRRRQDNLRVTSGG